MNPDFNLTDGEAALLTALRSLQARYDDRNDDACADAATIADLRGTISTLHNRLNDADATADYYRDLADRYHGEKIAAQSTLAAVRRALTGESGDTAEWARAYVAANPDATRKIAAIKSMRAAFPGISLRDAKDAIVLAFGEAEVS